MAIEDRITRVLEQAEAEGELGIELRQRIQVAVKQAFAIERTRLRSEKVVAMSEVDAVRYSIISELATDWVYAARREDEHGKVNIEWATEAFERITGYSVEQLNERGGLRSIVAPDDLPEIDAAEAGHTDGPSVLEYRIRTRSGDVLGQQRLVARNDQRRPPPVGARSQPADRLGLRRAASARTAESRRACSSSAPRAYRYASAP